MTAQQMFGMEPDGVELYGPTTMDYVVWTRAFFHAVPRLPCEDCIRRRLADRRWEIEFCGWHQRMRLDRYPPSYGSSVLEVDLNG